MELIPCGGRLPLDYKALIVSDVHVPYHHKKANETLLAWAKTADITHLVLNGDIGDFYSISRFYQDDRRLGFKQEVDEVKKYLSRWNAALPEAVKTLTEGNHEERLRRYVMKNAPRLGFALEEALSLRTLFELSAYGFRNFRSYEDPYFLPNLQFAVVHGTGYGPSVGKKEIGKRGVSGIQGHSHRMSMTIANHGGRVKWELHASSDLYLPVMELNLNDNLVWIEQGHMCDMAQADYLDDRGADWQMGCYMIEWNRKGANVLLTPIRFNEAGEMNIG